ncbi:MAG: DUF2914 domain-containing protein [Myxococcota bacterium]
MSRLNDSGALAMGAVAAAMFSVGMSLAVVACGSQPSEVAKSNKSASAGAEVKPIASVGAAVVARGVEAVQTAGSAAPTSSALASVKTVLSTNAVSAKSSSARGSGEVVVKRFVVASGVREREPVASEGALLADGKPIYAFAELANDGAEEAHVRITFERKGSSDRVGNVTLAVPAHSGRYRTWGNTRFVREAGTWEAVLWSEDGTELSRAAFEVVGS